jgi:hypothetical protein
MTNEELVLSRINNNCWIGKSKLHFKEPERSQYYYGWDYEENKTKYATNIKLLNSAKTVEDRIMAIINLGARTYDERNRYQCRSGARRSTVDLWRIYKYYYDENVDIFTIMRALYKLVTDSKLSTYRCPTVRKRVFWRFNEYPHKDLYVSAEIGLPMTEWEHIGENKENNNG